MEVRNFMVAQITIMDFSSKEKEMPKAYFGINGGQITDSSNRVLPDDQRMRVLALARALENELSVIAFETKEKEGSK